MKSGEVKRVCGCARKKNGRRNVRGKWIREKEVRRSRIRDKRLRIEVCREDIGMINIEI